VLFQRGIEQRCYSTIKENSRSTGACKDPYTMQHKLRAKQAACCGNRQQAEVIFTSGLLICECRALPPGQQHLATVCTVLHKQLT
jgi:hypothetical protein